MVHLGRRINYGLSAALLFSRTLYPYLFLCLTFTTVFVSHNNCFIAGYPLTRKEFYAWFTKKAVIRCRTYIYYQSSQR